MKRLPIVCSAHSSEPRRNVYDALKFLWDNGFWRGYLSIPHPLFYSEYFRGTFYRGVDGRNLYHYIREKNFAVIEPIVIRAARWFSKLHNLKTGNARNFNEDNSRIATVYPGIPHILWRIKKDFPRYADIYEAAYALFAKREKKFFASAERRWLIHGDAHPENIIKMGGRKIAVIDFTDLCLSDFTRDLGAFTQQLEFMCDRKIADPAYAAKLKNVFITEYFAHSPKRKMNAAVQERIDLYYYWTAMRTATFFLIKDKPEPERAEGIILKVKDWLANINR